jgi:hypothetical protein
VVYALKESVKWSIVRSINTKPQGDVRQLENDLESPQPEMSLVKNFQRDFDGIKFVGNIAT